MRYKELVYCAKKKNMIGEHGGAVKVFRLLHLPVVWWISSDLADKVLRSTFSERHFAQQKEDSKNTFVFVFPDYRILTYGYRLSGVQSVQVWMQSKIAVVPPNITLLLVTFCANNEERISAKYLAPHFQWWITLSSKWEIFYVRDHVRLSNSRHDDAMTIFSVRARCYKSHGASHQQITITVCH